MCNHEAMDEDLSGHRLGTELRGMVTCLVGTSKSCHNAQQVSMHNHVVLICHSQHDEAHLILIVWERCALESVASEVK